LHHPAGTSRPGALANGHVVMAGGANTGQAVAAARCTAGSLPTAPAAPATPPPPEPVPAEPEEPLSEPAAPAPPADPDPPGLNGAPPHANAVTEQATDNQRPTDEPMGETSTRSWP
jgi:hypothetical protein